MRTADSGLKARVSAAVRAALGQDTLPIGTVVRVGLGQYLKAPPEGTVWHRSRDAEYFELFPLVRHPVLELGDVIGLRQGDPIPLPPTGTNLVRIHDPEVPAGEEDRAAALYKVVGYPALAAAVAVQEPRYQAGRIYSVDSRLPPRAPPGKRWQILGVDGRNLHNLLVSLVGNAPVAAAAA